jgi:hypothetical protein
VHRANLYAQREIQITVYNKTQHHLACCDLLYDPFVEANGYIGILTMSNDIESYLALLRGGI